MIEDPTASGSAEVDGGPSENLVQVIIMSRTSHGPGKIGQLPTWRRSIVSLDCRSFVNGEMVDLTCRHDCPALWMRHSKELRNSPFAAVKKATRTSVTGTMAYLSLHDYERLAVRYRIAMICLSWMTYSDYLGVTSSNYYYCSRRRGTSLAVRRLKVHILGRAKGCQPVSNTKTVNRPIGPC